LREGDTFEHAGAFKGVAFTQPRVL